MFDVMPNNLRHRSMIWLLHRIPHSHSGKVTKRFRPTLDTRQNFLLTQTLSWGLLLPPSALYDLRGPTSKGREGKWRTGAGKGREGSG